MSHPNTKRLRLLPQQQWRRIDHTVGLMAPTVVPLAHNHYDDDDNDNDTVPLEEDTHTNTEKQQRHQRKNATGITTTTTNHNNNNPKQQTQTKKKKPTAAAAAAAGEDLEVRHPGEGVAIFLSLEVLDDVSPFLVRATATDDDNDVDVADDGDFVASKKEGNQKTAKSKTPSPPLPLSTTTSPATSATTTTTTTTAAIPENSKKKSKTKKMRKKTGNDTEKDGEKKPPSHDINDDDDKTQSSKSTTASTTKSTTNENQSSAIAALQETWQQHTRYVIPDFLSTDDSNDNARSRSLATTLLRLYGPDCRPTPIQAATLPAALLGQRKTNIVGAAPTGSGKTLAYLLPILQGLFSGRDPDRTVAAANDDDDDNNAPPPPPQMLLQALILTPTRELARQVHAACGEFLADFNAMVTATKNTTTVTNSMHTNNTHTNKIACGCITGGLAVAKQARILNVIRPAILIATPGRLWELMSSGLYAHLQDLSQIRFLVIDEADRMVLPHKTNGKTGGFAELHHILDAVQRANPLDEDDDEEDDDDGDEHDQLTTSTQRLRGLPGFPGEAHVEMIPEAALLLMREQHQKESTLTSESLDLHKEDNGERINGGEHNDEENEGFDWDEHDDTADMEDDSDEYPPLIADDHNDEDAEEEYDSHTHPSEKKKRVQRQTFIFSATLTLPSSDPNSSMTNNNKKRKRDGSNVGLAWKNVDGALAEILQKARAVGPTKIVDLTNTVTTTNITANSNATAKKSQPKSQQQQFQLPPGLQLQQIKCTQLHKDSHLYAYLLTTVSGAAGPALIFCNSVAAVRRVGATLTTLGLPVRLLHAQMAQRARFKAIESLQGTKTSQCVVVATDVAARGLDIPSVASVIHYDAARSIDTFVHRSGRTARGMGEDAVGCSLSLVASGEDKFHARIVKTLNVTFADVHMDGRLLSAAQERVNLACKVASADDAERKTHRDNQWFKDQAADAGLDVDDDLLDNGLANGDSRDQARLKEARSARDRLHHLLAQPIQTQRFGKFLSTNSAAKQRVIPMPVKVPSKQSSRTKRRRKK